MLELILGHTIHGDQNLGEIIRIITDKKFYIKITIKISQYIRGICSDT
jgi:hypothetical protein